MWIFYHSFILSCSFHVLQHNRLCWSRRAAVLQPWFSDKLACLCIVSLPRWIWTTSPRATLRYFSRAITFTVHSYVVNCPSTILGRLIFMGTQQCSSELMCKSTTAEPCCSSSIRDAEGFSGHEPASVTLFFLLPYAACHCPFAEGRERAHSKERERKIISSYPRLLKYVIAVCVKNIIIVKVFVWLSE